MILWAIRIILRIIGFGIQGPIRGSLAALLQAVLYGGRIAGGSMFAICQSLAMRKGHSVRSDAVEFGLRTIVCLPHQLRVRQRERRQFLDTGALHAPIVRSISPSKLE
ncbi:hypothetical protein VTN00DRAFT_3550 [Thermoascus crustaceus]|uniref:uncharacterized protein n=1 Tax=Thermoascus crustaceus TaxID=5088 RepID=UPI003743FCB9